MSAEDGTEESERKSTLNTLYAVNGLHMVAMIMLMDAKMVVYMRHFKGDAARVAKASALGMSIMTISGMFTTPLLSALSDIYGRKALLLLSPLWSFMSRVVETTNPTARVVQTTTALGALQMASIQGMKTSVGDLFPGDPKGAGGAMAMMQVGPLVAAALGPQLGGALAMKDVRLPFALSAFLCAVESILVLRCVPETRPATLDSNSMDGIWQKLNPFKFLGLFARGPKLGLLAFAQLLSDLVEARIIGQNSSLIHTSTLGWGIPDRARFMTVSSIVSAPGYAMAGKFSKKLGSRMALLAGSSAMVLQNLLDSLVTKPWQQFALLLVGSPRGTGVAALSSSLMEAAADAGMGQAELQGSLTSLQQVSMAMAFPLWARICGAFIKSGKPRHFYLVVAAVAAVQLMISQGTLLLQDGQPERGSTFDGRRRMSLKLTPQTA